MILDPVTRILNYARAGHNRLIHQRGSRITPDKSKGLTIGVDSGKLFDKLLDENIIQLSKGERIFAYTDGVTEAQDYDEEEFGEENLEKIVQECKGNSAELINQIVNAVNEHQEDMPQHDDITMITFKCNA